MGRKARALVVGLLVAASAVGMSGCHVENGQIVSDPSDVPYFVCVTLHLSLLCTVPA
jgi:hypothetical protein